MISLCQLSRIIQQAVGGGLGAIHRLHQPPVDIDRSRSPCGNRLCIPPNALAIREETTCRCPFLLCIAARVAEIAAVAGQQAIEFPLARISQFRVVDDSLVGIRQTARHRPAVLAHLLHLDAGIRNLFVLLSVLHGIVILPVSRSCALNKQGKHGIQQLLLSFHFYSHCFSIHTLNVSPLMLPSSSYRRYSRLYISIPLRRVVILSNYLHDEKYFSSRG